ncbi:MAG: TIGR03915 family putative DNA repair protein [Bacteroidaceae bacterium]|nr:TIGR03915 family putative DNA repair protein [Bacteroidaceae bacterium]
MLAYTFDHTLDGLLTAVFDAYALHQAPESLIVEGDILPMFCNQVHHVRTADDKARRVWAGLEKRLSRDALRMITVAWLSEEQELPTPLFHYICKVFRQPEGAPSLERNFSDPDVLSVTNTARRVMHEQHRMKQFVRFQKTKDGTYLGVVSPDHNVLPLIVHHFRDRFGDQPWLLYDARRRYGFYYDRQEVVRITFEDEDALPFDLQTGRLSSDVISQDDQLFQDLWRTYFKAICIRQRMNPRKQLNDMPRRYWKYMTEMQ